MNDNTPTNDEMVEAHALDQPLPPVPAEGTDPLDIPEFLKRTPAEVKEETPAQQ